MPENQLRCRVCGKLTADWAVHETPVPFVFPRRNIAVKPGDLVCGDCLGHALKTGAVSDAGYNSTAAKTVNKAERERLADKFLK